jgi:hypothetical protein
MHTPWKDGPHPVGEGIQKVYRFKNGYGASVVRFQILGLHGSHTTDTTWELAVVRFEGDKWRLVYDTGITSDVMDYLTDVEVEAVLDRIQALKPKQTERP